jgi:predicted O-methyltransferase YrrM
MNKTLETILTYDDISQIDLTSSADLVIETEFRNYYLSNPGLEHYKLLAFISKLYEHSNLIEIGTYKGCSALALSYNKTNNVHTFDVQPDLISLISIPDNVSVYTDDIISDKHIQLLKSSTFIFLDTNHDGTFEHAFLNHLENIQWKGYLLLDDIFLNNEMKMFWESISYEKFDISNVGHHSGTGLIKIV